MFIVVFMSPTPSIIFFLPLPFLMLWPLILLTLFEIFIVDVLQIHLLAALAHAVVTEPPHLLVKHASIRCDVLWVL